jgi:hypothetical protein
METLRRLIASGVVVIVIGAMGILICPASYPMLPNEMCVRVGMNELYLLSQMGFNVMITVGGFLGVSVYLATGKWKNN